MRGICRSGRLGSRSGRELMALAISCLAVSSGSAFSSAAAQTTPDTVASRRFGHTTLVPSARAFPRSSAIALDGRLDEAAWRAATPITQFTQSDPDEGRPPSQKTEVRFL